MAILIRRSNLLVPMTNEHLVENAWRYQADAIILDLEDGVAESRRSEARTLVKNAIAQVGRGAAEVFVRVNKPYLYADIAAASWPGLRGIMLPCVESGAEVYEAAEVLTTMERQHGLAVGSLQIIVLLESARGVWHMREILTASRRITQVGLEESDLAGSLGFTSLPDYDPFVYARGRVVIEAIAGNVQPLGVVYPLGTQPRLLAAEELRTHATNSKNLGFKGILCPHPDWVAPVNLAFTPTTEQVQYSTRVREVFAQAVASGTAAVPLDGRMIDVPVDEWAKVVLAMASACAARDAEKQNALARPEASA
jgi:citrate lyase subunit beta/citryl-CoA lyase